MTFFLFLVVIALIIAITFVLLSDNKIRESYKKLENENANLADERTRYSQLNEKSQLKITEQQNSLQAIQSKLANESYEKQRINEIAQKLKQENTRLEKWKNIANAEDKAKEILVEAQAKIDTAMKALEDYRKKVNADSDRILSDAKEKYNREMKALEEHRRQANEGADLMVSGAKIKADKYAAVVKAMQNRIEGYGLEYIVPGVGLLDDLADDFSHAMAGQKLKDARQKVRDMFKAGTAATCDYVEKNRKDTAIAFVADAFNGKVEDVLSRVRHDNYGKLAQQIKDAEVLVNQNGEAFRNAKISHNYVEARLEELKWATVVHELKVKEREEQRMIREQIREEKKVQKEIEKARKEAEKALKEQERQQRERDALQRAIDEARARGELESKLQKMISELAAKDQVIAEKQQLIDDSQRAISMAQQTKAGHVYIISNIGSFGNDVFKIGMTRRLDPEDRVNELGGASVPFPFDIHAMIRSDNAPELEHKLHQIFLLNQVNKTNVRKEFFSIGIGELKTAIEKLGGVAHWTMTAEAAQYRETLRINEQIKVDPEYRAQWEARQIRLEEAMESIGLSGDSDEDEEF